MLFKSNPVSGRHPGCPPAPAQNGRKRFSLSRPENGVITYYAAAELLAGEKAADFGATCLILPKGEYTSIVIKNYVKDILSIGRTFENYYPTRR